MASTDLPVPGPPRTMSTCLCSAARASAASTVSNTSFWVSISTNSGLPCSRPCTLSASILLGRMRPFSSV